MEHIPAAPETKSADLASAFDEFMRNFEAFKEQNDGRIAQIEKKTADPLTDEKVMKIGMALDANKRVLDELVLKSRRPALGRESKVLSAAELEHRSAFDAYVRHGEATGLKRLEGKALAVSTGSGADGGFLVPEETEREIGRRLAQVSPIRAIAGHREVSSNVYRKPFLITGAASGWVGETAARPQTDSPTLAELSFPTLELYAMPAATQTLLDDSAVNIDEWIASEIDTVFAEQEGTAFVAGDGNNKPKGFLAYTTVAESAWEWGKLGFVLTGADGGFAASDPSDALVDLVYALKAGYRQNGTFVMNRRTQAEIRKLKDDAGNYIWQPPAVAGGQATLMGFPVAEAEDMPDIDDDSLSVAFGDFRRGYLVVDRMGVRVLRDPYSAKPYVLFYVTKRVGGGVADFDAIKLLKFAAA
ncbi:MAG: phage major capsid protein [Bradyrhizobiaceae bacterium]|nr:phage major capsid protein [Bradyrhizobiaceae bacterium]